jgi:hypothetical protein
MPLHDNRQAEDADRPFRSFALYCTLLLPRVPTKSPQPFVESLLWSWSNFSEPRPLKSAQQGHCGRRILSL